MRRRLTPYRALLLAALPAITLAGAARAGEDPGPLAALEILVVSPLAAQGHGADLEKHLARQGAEVKTVSWAAASVGAARSFDLVIVTGGNRGLTGAEVRGYDRPVLGIGPYGHAYFGSMRLKHGHPFS